MVMVLVDVGRCLLAGLDGKAEGGVAAPDVVVAVTALKVTEQILRKKIYSSRRCQYDNLSKLSYCIMFYG